MPCHRVNIGEKGVGGLAGNHGTIKTRTPLGMAPALHRRPCHQLEWRHIKLIPQDFQSETWSLGLVKRIMVRWTALMPQEMSRTTDRGHYWYKQQPGDRMLHAATGETTGTEIVGGLLGETKGSISKLLRQRNHWPIRHRQRHTETTAEMKTQSTFTTSEAGTLTTVWHMTEDVTYPAAAAT